MGEELGLPPSVRKDFIDMTKVGPMGDLYVPPSVRKDFIDMTKVGPMGDLYVPPWVRRDVIDLTTVDPRGDHYFPLADVRPEANSGTCGGSSICSQDTRMDSLNSQSPQPAEMSQICCSGQACPQFSWPKGLIVGPMWDLEGPWVWPEDMERPDWWPKEFWPELVEDQGTSIEVTEGYELRCGPDVTEWLVEQLNAAANHPRVKEAALGWRRAQAPGNARVALAEAMGAIFSFKEIAVDPNILDPKAKYRDKWIIPQKCPLDKKCSFTLTICGECYRADAPGNLLFSYTGHKIVGFSKSFLKWGAARFAKETRGQEEKGDLDLYDAGWSLDTPVTREGLCNALKKFVPPKKIYRIAGELVDMSPARRPRCAPCPDSWMPD